MWDTEFVNKAIIFATTKHDGQYMKYPKDAPYSSHIMGVTLTAINFASRSLEKTDFDFLLCCAIMHDCLEDTQATYEEIKQEFNEDIANGVLALTRDDKIDESIQIKDCIERIKREPREVAMVKLADRIFNMRCQPPCWSKEKLEAYKADAQLICDELGYACDAMRIELQKRIDEYFKN